MVVEPGEYSYIGKIQHAYGAKGWVKIKFKAGLKPIGMKQTYLFLLHDKIHVPYRIIKKNASKSIILFDDLSTLKQAERLERVEVFVLADQLPNQLQENQHPFIGYSIYDLTTNQMIGVIEFVNNQTAQDLAFTRLDSKEIMIPIHERLIDRVDESSRVLYMVLPEGLLDID